MGEAVPQTFENHTVKPRPWALALLLILLGTLSAFVGVFLLDGDRGAYFIAGGLMLNGAGSFIGVGLVRHYALQLQDRIIRVEMRSRLERILPPEDHQRIPALGMKQFAAMRFASDAEMPELLRKVLDEDVQNLTQIKKMVRDWQADHDRV